MVRGWEVRWEGELPAGPQDVWDAITQHADGYPWRIDYEPRLGGAERGLTAGGGTVTAEDFDRQLDACRQHTTFYQHSLGQYACHFAGRDPVYVSVDGPASSAEGGFVALRRALGLPDDVVAGDRVCLEPACLAPIDGVVDYATGAFLGVRGTDALLRFYGRDRWGWPVGVAHHLFAPGADAAASERAWGDWVAGVFAGEGVA